MAPAETIEATPISEVATATIAEPAVAESAGAMATSVIAAEQEVGETMAAPAEEVAVTPIMAQLGLSGEPYATSGDPGAPLTVVEFSDYG